MRYKSGIKHMLLLLIGVLGICGCAGGLPGEIKEDVSANGTKTKVALITKSTNSAFWKSVYSGAAAAATEYNLDLVFEGPEVEEDYETQNDMIKKAVADGTDAIVFSAVDYEANAEEINEAAKAGVKIVVIDSDVNSKKVSCRIGTDNYEAGRTAGQAALDCEEEVLNIGIVNFAETTENGQSREKGFRDEVEKDDRAVIVKSINVLSSIAAARAGTQQMLKSHPEINVIVTFNEWTSLGVAYAIQEMQLADTTRVVAFDSNVVCVDMLETGEVDALVVQNPYAMGYLGVESAYQLLNGSDVKAAVVDTSTRLVTRENMYTDESQRMLFSFDD